MSSTRPVLFEIQEALLSVLYPLQRRAPRYPALEEWKTKPFLTESPCCNCKRSGNWFAKTVFWTENLCSTSDKPDCYPAWIWLHFYYGSLAAPHHYFSDAICEDCAYAVKQFIQDNIIASFKVSLKEFDSICTFFPHELNRNVLQYANPLLR